MFVKLWQMNFNDKIMVNFCNKLLDLWDGWNGEKKVHDFKDEETFVQRKMIINMFDSFGD